MSIQALKKKGVARYGSKVSGKSPGGIWQMQGPFGNNSSMFKNVERTPGPVGFSLNGGRRNVGYVGQSMAMSRNGTPYYGEFAKGNGGHYGQYNNNVQPVFNAARAATLGNQYMYIKPTVVSTKSMLESKYMWIHNGQYPNYWVQPVYGNDNLSNNSSQRVYIDRKAAANITVTDTNKPEIYVGYRTCGVGPRGGAACPKTSARYTFVAIDRQHGYTKTIRQPQTSQQYTTQIQRQCSNPTGVQKPFPFATRSIPSSTSVYNAGVINSPSNPVKTIIYYSPPDWYTQDKPSCSK